MEAQSGKKEKPRDKMLEEERKWTYHRGEMNIRSSRETLACCMYRKT